MRRAWLVVLLHLSGGAIAQSPPPSLAELPAAVTAALERAGSARPALETWLAGLEGEQREAACFLVGSMPTTDLVTLTPEQIQAELEVAFRTRQLPWARSIPLPIFLHYVLPYRVTQEAFEPWRQQLFDELVPQLEPCKGMADVALAVNRWCGARVRFVQTEFRDQGVLPTLRAGYGRCEEMMIVCISALRAVGLPARPCSTPWWVTQDNNHAWVEVWVDGHWYYMGGCEPAKTLDRAWFTGPAQRAGAVISTMFGAPDWHPTGEVICRSYPRAALVNSTGAYARTGEARVRVVDGDGNPVPDCPVAASCFNYGGLRPLLVQETDAEGRTSLVTGMGDYFLTAGTPEARAWHLFHADPEQPTAVTLELQPGAAPPAELWLRYPTVAEARRLARGGMKGAGKVSAQVEVELTPPPTPDRYDPEARPSLETLLESRPAGEELREVLRDALGHWRELAGALEQCPEEHRAALAALLLQTTHLDRLEVRAGVLLDHVVEAARWSQELDPTLHREFVLRAGIDIEHLGGPWRRQLAGELEPLRQEDPAATVVALQDWIKVHVQEEEPDRLGPAQHPGQVLVSGHATSLEARIFLVGALRALGVPARLSSTREHVDFHDGDRWQTVDPRPALEGDEEEAAGSAAPGTIRLRLTRNGAPLGSDFHGLDVAPFRRGAWIPLRRYAHRLEEDHHVMELPAADYLVTAGVRNANGDAWVRTALVQLEGGQVEALDWSLDLPPDSGLFTFPVVRAIDVLPDCSLGEGAEARTLPELATEGPLLLVLVRPGHEPCQRMLPLIDEAHTTWLAPVGTRTLGLLVSAGEGELPGVSFPMVPAPEGLAEALQLSGDDVSLPSVLLLRDGKPLLWQEGYDLEIGTLLQHAARQL